MRITPSTCVRDLFPLKGQQTSGAAGRWIGRRFDVSHVYREIRMANPPGTNGAKVNNKTKWWEASERRKGTTRLLSQCATSSSGRSFHSLPAAAAAANIASPCAREKGCFVRLPRSLAKRCQQRSLLLSLRRKRKRYADTPQSGVVVGRSVGSVPSRDSRLLSLLLVVCAPLQTCPAAVCSRPPTCAVVCCWVSKPGPTRGPRTPLPGPAPGGLSSPCTAAGTWSPCYRVTVSGPR